MKFLLLLWIASFVLFSSDCPSRQTNKATNSEIKNQAVAPDTATANQSQMPNEARNYKNRTKDLEYKIQARLETRKSDKTGAEENYVAVNYTVKNLGGKDYILFNRGHSIENDARRVCVEFQADGIAELSQKAFAEPKDTVCPNTDAPILPRATRLKAGQSFSERAEITFPLQMEDHV